MRCRLNVLDVCVYKYNQLLDWRASCLLNDVADLSLSVDFPRQTL